MSCKIEKHSGVAFHLKKGQQLKVIVRLSFFRCDTIHSDEINEKNPANPKITGFLY